VASFLLWDLPRTVNPVVLREEAANGVVARLLGVFDLPNFLEK